MKSSAFLSIVAAALPLLSCTARDSAPAATVADQAPSASPAATGMAAVQDDESARNVVKIAVDSPDHTTLVAAVKAGQLVDVLASSGPYTVFAPTNAAFDKLPKGTVEDLLKPENLAKLQAILRHHVTTSVYEVSELKDGQSLGMADGTSATIVKKGADLFIGDAKVLGSVRGTNGMVHVVDAVVLPPAK